MAVATVELPDGRRAKIEVPSGTPPEQIQAQVAEMYSQGAFGQKQPSKQEYYRELNNQIGGGKPSSLVLDSVRERANMPQVDSASSNPALRVLGELAASANRTVTEMVDFLGPNTINNILSLSGSQKRVPTLTGALEDYGIQGNFMEPGAAREAVQAGGNLLTAGVGMVPVKREIGTVASTVADVLGAGSTAVTQPFRDAAPYVSETLGNLTPSNPLTAGKRKAAELPLKRMTGDIDAFGYKLDSAGKVVADPTQKAAAKQGFEEGLVTMVKATDPQTRQNMRAMLDVVEQGKRNFKSQAVNRPLDIVGDSITSRVKVIQRANQAAGRRLDGVAKSLQGKAVDPQPAVEGLVSSLDDMGIKLNVAPGKMEIDFSGSDIEGLEGSQKVVTNMLKRLFDTKSPDAYDVHRMKRFIDENVTYGKSQEGLSGRVEGIFKTLRRELDGILDSQFPEYNRVNTQYSETIGALDALQDVAGKKVNLMGDNVDKALGTLSRRLLSNAQSRVPLMDALGQADSVAKKYVTSSSTDVVPYAKVMESASISPDSLNDDLIAQVMFVDELEKTFGTHARTSLQGDVAKVADRAIDTVAGSQTMFGAAAEGAKAGYRFSRGINEENALKALRKLLEE